MIELEDFRVDFKDFSLGPLSLSIHDGERVALVGVNGAGKSTALRGIAGLLPDGYRGSAKVDGREVRKQGAGVRALVGLLPERLTGFGWMTVTEHLEFLRAFHPTWDGERATSLANRLELPSRTKLAHLSKGMQVKLSLVAVAAYRPPILLLDEPTSGIDPVMRQEVLALLRECAPREGGHTVVFSSHILEDVDAVSDRVLLLRKGSLVADLRVDDVRPRDGGSISQELLQRLGAA